jgi:hypothetical protein
MLLMLELAARGVPAVEGVVVVVVVIGAAEEEEEAVMAGAALLQVQHLCNCCLGRLVQETRVLQQVLVPQVPVQVAWVLLPTATATAVMEKTAVASLASSSKVLK